MRAQGWMILGAFLVTVACLFGALVLPFSNGMRLTLFTIAGLIVLFNAFYMARPLEAYIIERLGKFARASTGGLRVKIPFLENIVGRVSLQVQPLKEPVTSISKDKTAVQVDLAIQYQIIADTRQDGAIYNAFYRLQDASAQLKQALYDTVRSVVPEHEFDEIYLKKDDLANAVNTRLGPKFKNFGFEIVDVNIIGIDPTDSRVLAAMAEINVAKRQADIAQAEGEAKRIRMEKDGEGMGDQRLAILKKYQKEVPDAKAEDLMNMVLMTQYFETMQSMAASGKTTTVFLPGSPAGLTDLQGQIRNAIMSAGAAHPTTHMNGADPSS